MLTSIPGVRLHLRYSGPCRICDFCSRVVTTWRWCSSIARMIGSIVTLTRDGLVKHYRSSFRCECPNEMDRDTFSVSRSRSRSRGHTHVHRRVDGGPQMGPEQRVSDPLGAFGFARWCLQTLSREKDSSGSVPTTQRNDTFTNVGPTWTIPLHPRLALPPPKSQTDVQIIYVRKSSPGPWAVVKIMLQSSWVWM